MCIHLEHELTALTKSEREEARKANSFRGQTMERPLQLYSSNSFKDAPMVSNQFYKMKLLALGALLVFTQGCSQKLGYIQPRQGRDTGIARIFTLGEIVENATLLGADGYLFGTGSDGQDVRNLFGYYGFSSGAYISGVSALAFDPAAKTFIDGDVRNILSMVKAGNTLYVSSNLGLYEIDLRNITVPTVRYSLPYSARLTDPSAYRFDSMVYVPSLNEVWGFRGNWRARFVAGALNINTLIWEQQPINTSCFSEYKSSSAFFQGKVFVAACNQVVVYDSNRNILVPANSASPDPLDIIRQLKAVQVVTSGNMLYVHHLAQSGNGSGFGGYSNPYSSIPTGVYVFDSNLKYVNYIDIDPLSFAVSPDNQIIFANEDNADVGAYRIPWTNSTIR